MSGDDLGQVAAVSGLFIVLTLRWRSLLRAGPERALLLTFWALGCTAVFDLLPVYRAVQRHTGPGVPAALRDAGVIVAATALVWFVDIVEDEAGRLDPAAVPQRRRRHLAAAFLLSVLSVSPWLISPPGHPASALAAVPDWFDTTWRTPMHVLPVVAATSYALTLAARSAWLSSAADYDGAMRVALRVISIGALLSGPFVALKTASVILWLAGVGVATLKPIAAAEAAIQGVSLVTVGVGASLLWVYRRAARTDTENRMIQPLAPLLALLPEADGAEPHAASPLTLAVVRLGDLFLELTSYGRNDIRDEARDASLAAGDPVEAALDKADAIWLADALRRRAANDLQVTPSVSPYCNPDPHAAALRLAGIAAAWTQL